MEAAALLSCETNMLGGWRGGESFTGGGKCRGR